MPVPPCLQSFRGRPADLLAAIRTERRRQCLVAATRRRVESGELLRVYLAPAAGLARS